MFDCPQLLNAYETMRHHFRIEHVLFVEGMDHSTKFGQKIAVFCPNVANMINSLHKSTNSIGVACTNFEHIPYLRYRGNHAWLPRYSAVTHPKSALAAKLDL